ncbi:uncharacterized protein LOC129582772 isoform X2 [Paramacrobiotus metropolitanus]|uniref:uncharacterized protein LOC129582772 isoform X2 n=1 Tax=Paramacrobiotus metropolitanus TaxID=2943436 RepID=UPI002445B496|nr:uncharacterized protein LOC129582772 isoform X2 [Paramacrobiotus metropolitanus]
MGLGSEGMISQCQEVGVLAAHFTAKLRMKLQLDTGFKLVPLTTEGSGTVTDEAQSSTTEQCSLSLPLVLLTEIFLSLDTIDRKRCRRVCNLWDEILTSASVSQIIHISFEQPSFTARLKSCRSVDYVAYGCIFKHITAATRTLCLRNWEEISNDGIIEMEPERRLTTGKMMVCVKEALEDIGARLDRLIVHRLSISSARFSPILLTYFGSVADLYFSLATCCNRVIWKNFSLSCHYGLSDSRIEFRFPYAFFLLRSVDTAQIWDLFEHHVVCSEAMDMELLEYWTNELITRQVNDVGQKLAEAILLLDAYQRHGSA